MEQTHCSDRKTGRMNGPIPLVAMIHLHRNGTCRLVGASDVVGVLEVVEASLTGVAGVVHCKPEAGEVQVGSTTSSVAVINYSKT